MLSMRPVLNRDGLAVSDVRCSHGRGSATEPELAPSRAVVFVRRGCFARTVDGERQVLDPTLAYFMNPGEEQRFDHPHEHGDDCTAIILSPEVAAQVWGGEPELPSGTISTSPQLDVRQRVLLSHAGRPRDEHELYESALTLVAETLENVDARRVATGRPSGVRARRALADDVLEALSERPDRSLPELAGAVSTSPHHLSRAFLHPTGA